MSKCFYSLDSSSKPSRVLSHEKNAKTNCGPFSLVINCKLRSVIFFPFENSCCPSSYFYFYIFCLVFSMMLHPARPRYGDSNEMHSQHNVVLRNCDTITFVLPMTKNLAEFFANPTATYFKLHTAQCVELRVGSDVREINFAQLQKPNRSDAQQEGQCI